MSCITLPIIFQDHMVLQQQKDIFIQGTCSSAGQLTIQFDAIQIAVPVIQNKFQCTFPAQEAGYHHTISFYLENNTEPEVVLKDISIGDVWLAAGQSNMEYFLRYDAHWNDTKRLPKNNHIHMFNMPQIAFEGQQRDLPDSGYWFQEGDSAWGTFSAPGYYFVRNLQPHLDIPVAVIGCNWGGTPACAWMEEHYLSKEPLTIFQKEYLEAISNVSSEKLKEESLRSWAFEDNYHHQIEWRAMMYGLTYEEQQVWMKEHASDPVLPMGPYHHYRPSGLYHTMIEKLAPFSLKGILWYQGESDSGHADIYDQTMTALIQCYRDTFQDADLPFLFAQLAPFRVWLDCIGDHYEIVRQMQDNVSKAIPHTGMISLMDLGMYEDIHPKFKREVGERFALLARGTVYGENILCESPEVISTSLNHNSITLTCTNFGKGLTSDAEPAREFSLSVNGKNIEILQCDVKESEINLSFDYSVDKTLSASFTLSYCYQPYCNGNIWNSAGLPLKPFHQIISLS